MRLISNPRATHGFTLVELAIVLVIVALLTSGLMLGITAQRNAVENNDAQRQLENIREALLGYTMANGRLPCPALPNIANTHSDAGKENCTQSFGVMPWATLGLAETDPWGNRFTYFASSQYTALPTGSALAGFTLSTGISPNSTADLATIKDRTGGSTVASDIPVVIVSHGSRSAGAYQPSGNQLPGASSDEQENANTTQTFISHTPNGTFDDLLTWISPSVLKSKMVAAGRLP